MRAGSNASHFFQFHDAVSFGVLQPLPIESVERLGPSGKFASCTSFAGANSCGIEWDEWMMVDALVRPDDIVIEFGARYGTTSCRLASATRNSGRVVAVDPDRTVLRDLRSNLQKHRCSVAVLSGTVSDVPLALNTPRGGRTHYGTTSRVAAPGAGAVGNMAFGALEASIGGQFTVALIDCEGCISHVAAAPGDLFGQVSLVLMEEVHCGQILPNLMHTPCTRHTLTLILSYSLPDARSDELLAGSLCGERLECRW